MVAGATSALTNHAEQSPAVVDREPEAIGGQSVQDRRCRGDDARLPCPNDGASGADEAQPKPLRRRPAAEVVDDEQVMRRGTGKTQSGDLANVKAGIDSDVGVGPIGPDRLPSERLQVDAGVRLTFAADSQKRREGT